LCRYFTIGTGTEGAATSDVDIYETCGTTTDEEAEVDGELDGFGRHDVVRIDHEGFV
jgi:hypothetical protein